VAALRKETYRSRNPSGTSPLCTYLFFMFQKERILTGIQLARHFIKFAIAETREFVGSNANVILTRHTCGQRSSRAAGSKHRALGNYFSMRICYKFPISQCRGEPDLGLCTTSVLAKKMLLRIRKSWQVLRSNTFSNRKLPPRSGILLASIKIVHRYKLDSLHFDIRNI